MSKTITTEYGDMYVKCNGHERELFALDQLPAKDAADFDYIEGEDRFSFRLFQYRGSWYDSAEFEIAPDRFKRLGFDGIQTESAFSAVIARYFDEDGHELDGIIVGYVHW